MDTHIVSFLIVLAIIAVIFGAVYIQVRKDIYQETDTPQNFPEIIDNLPSMETSQDFQEEATPMQS